MMEAVPGPRLGKKLMELRDGPHAKRALEETRDARESGQGAQRAVRLGELRKAEV